MIQLCGFPVSNYHNKVKLALLEKGVAFEEVIVYPSQRDDLLAESPMGKVPYLRAGEGTLAESQAIVEYLDDTHPDPALYPRDAFARAKVRELIEMIELHLELPARRLYPEAFFGGKVSDETKRVAEESLTRGLRAFDRLARFSPCVAGDAFTHADCAAIVHLPLVSGATRAVFGADMVGALVSGAGDYLKAMADRPSVRVVNAARKAGMEAFMAMRAASK